MKAMCRWLLAISGLVNVWVVHGQSFEDALDTTNLVWTASAHWAPLNHSGVDSTHDGVDAVRAPEVLQGADNFLETMVTVTNLSSVAFWWEFSPGGSASAADQFVFFVDGESRAVRNGVLNAGKWRSLAQTATVVLSPGTHRLRWEIRSGNSSACGGAVDEFRINPLNVPAPAFISPLLSVSAKPDSPVQLSSATEFHDLFLQYPFSYQWFHNGQPLAGATSSLLRIAKVKDTNAGAYHLVAIPHPIFGFGAITSDVARVRIVQPGTLTKAGELTLPAGEVKDIAIAGDRAYVAAGAAGLYEVDLSNPATPQIRSVSFQDRGVVAIATSGLAAGQPVPVSTHRAVRRANVLRHAPEREDGFIAFIDGSGKAFVSFEGATPGQEIATDAGAISVAERFRGHERTLLSSLDDEVLRHLVAIAKPDGTIAIHQAVQIYKEGSLGRQRTFARVNPEVTWQTDHSLQWIALTKDGKGLVAGMLDGSITAWSLEIVEGAIVPKLLFTRARTEGSFTVGTASYGRFIAGAGAALYAYPGTAAGVAGETSVPLGSPITDMDATGGEVGAALVGGSEVVALDILNNAIATASLPLATAQERIAVSPPTPEGDTVMVTGAARSLTTLLHQRPCAPPTVEKDFPRPLPAEWRAGTRFMLQARIAGTRPLSAELNWKAVDLTRPFGSEEPPFESPPLKLVRAVETDGTLIAEVELPPFNGLVYEVYLKVSNACGSATTGSGPLVVVGQLSPPRVTMGKVGKPVESTVYAAPSGTSKVTVESSSDLEHWQTESVLDDLRDPVESGQGFKPLRIWRYSRESPKPAETDITIQADDDDWFIRVKTE